MHALTTFDNHLPPGLRISADVTVQGQELVLRFEVQDKAGLVQDTLVPGSWRGHELNRADELWKTTCFEAFFGFAGKASYWEVNVSGNLPRYNVYRFNDYRQPQPPTRDEAFVASDLVRSPHSLTLRLAAPFPLQGIEANLCAVVRTAEGVMHFSFKHAGAKPDFHLRDGFVLRP